MRTQVISASSTLGTREYLVISAPGILRTRDYSKSLQLLREYSVISDPGILGNGEYSIHLRPFPSTHGDFNQGYPQDSRVVSHFSSWYPWGSLELKYFSVGCRYRDDRKNSRNPVFRLSVYLYPWQTYRSAGYQYRGRTEP